MSTEAFETHPTITVENVAKLVDEYEKETSGTSPKIGTGESLAIGFFRLLSNPSVFITLQGTGAIALLTGHTWGGALFFLGGMGLGVNVGERSGNHLRDSLNDLIKSPNKKP